MTSIEACLRPRRSAAWILFALLAAVPPSPARAGPAAAQEELLGGVRAFRAERYEDALAAFRRLQASGAVPEIGFYLGTTLHKLGRHGEALAAFRAARRAGTREPVGEYYQALSCYRLGLLQRARQGFAALLAPGGGARLDPGPRLREGAGRFVQRIDALLAQLPAGARYEAVLVAAQAAPPAEAVEWLEEAALLLPQQADRPVAAARLRPLLGRLGAALPAGEAAALSQSVGP